MAHRAVADVLRVRHFPVVVHALIESDDYVRVAARQVRPHVDLVRHQRHIDRIPRVRVHSLRRMAQDAQTHLLPRTAVQRQRIMTLVARRRPHHVADLRHRSPVRDEVLQRVRVITRLPELRHVASSIDPYRVRRRPVVVRGKGGLELVHVRTHFLHRVRSARIRTRLHRRDTRDRARLWPCRVRHVLRGVLRDVGHDEARRHRAGRHVARSIQRLPLVVGNLEDHHRLLVRRDVRVHDLQVQPRPYPNPFFS